MESEYTIGHKSADFDRARSFKSMNSKKKNREAGAFQLRGCILLLGWEQRQARGT